MKMHKLPLTITVGILGLLLLAPQPVWALDDQCVSDTRQFGAGRKAEGVAQEVPNGVAAPKSVTLTLEGVTNKYEGQCTCRKSYYNFPSTETVNVPDDKRALIVPEDITSYYNNLESDGRVFLFCSQATLDQMYANKEIKATANTQEGITGEVAQADTVSQYIIAGINGILWVIARILLWILEQLSWLVGTLLGYGSFITHPFVKAGWPFLLGIANLGFVLSLLFIAAATTLNISGFSARRMLPRLLISALLINFSLILAGLMVDITRIVMAGMASFLGSTNLQAIGLDILKKSQLLGTVVKVTTNGVELGDLANSTQWYDVVIAFQGVFLIGIITLGFAILALGLIVRHITLLLLLVISPLPYLAFALPGLSQYANGWWKKFMAQLLYGPAALLVLILIAIVGGAVEGGLLSIVFTAVLLGAAAKFGKSAGTIGGAAVTDYFSGKARGAVRGVGRGAGQLGLAGLRATQAIPYVGAIPRGVMTPIRYGRGLIRGMGERTKDIATDVEQKGFKVGVGKRSTDLSPEKRLEQARIQEARDAQALGVDVDKYRELQGKAALSAGFKNPDGTADVTAWREAQALEKLKGTPTTPGTAGATPAGTSTPAPTPSGPVAPTGPMLTQMVKNAVGIRDDVTTGAMTIQQALQLPALAAQNLQSSDIKDALGTTVVNQVVLNSSDVNQVMSVVRDENYVSKLDQNALNDLAVALQRNANLGSIGVLDAQDALLETLNRLRNKPTP